jgi:predicted 3-demethylubiquinone-9 3-methyltransferase (glyoxalase superfamily)
MKKEITPNLWFEGNAKEAAEFYVSVFPDSKIVSTTYYPEEGLGAIPK